jgi:predicted peptidase
VLPKYIKEKYDAKVIIVTGLSMGGYGTYFMQYLNPDIVYAIAPICGSHSKFAASTWPEIRAWHFHGDRDSTVPLSSATKFIDAYNASHTSKIRLTIYAGIAHNSWDKAYSITEGQDELLQQIYKWFNEAYPLVPPVPPTDWQAEYNKLKNRIDSAILVLKGD